MSPKSALKESLGSLGLPSGLVAAAYYNYQHCESRYWLLDNSQPMNIMDSHLGRMNRERGSFDRVDGIMRWEELEDCVRFHADMASQCWIPSTYVLINDPLSRGGKWAQSEGLDLCRGRSRDVPSEVKDIHDALTNVQLDQRRCPLAHCIRTLVEELREDADRVEARDRHSTVIICTQGRPTNTEGGVGKAVLKDFGAQLAVLSDLPVKIIVRLCTDTEDVQDMYNTLDVNFDCIDVLDDFWGEAMEVHLYNSWLTYTIGLHRLRESGLAPDMMDELDEQPLSLDDIHKLCKMLFLQENSKITLPHPEENWNAFFAQVTVLSQQAGRQWNPVKSKLMPWIDMRKLEVMNPSLVERPELPISPSFVFRPPVREECPQRYNYRVKNPALTKVGKDLASCIHRWSHAPPNYTEMHPLERLLLTLPKGISLTVYEYKAVEPHTYFGKRKAMDKRAFQDCQSEEDYFNLLKRAVRNAKFFLNPNKYPKDFSKDQTELLVTMRNIIRDSEEATLGHGANY